MILTDPSIGGTYSFSLYLESCLWLLCYHTVNRSVDYALSWTKLISHVMLSWAVTVFFSSLGHWITMFSICSWCPAQIPFLVRPSSSCCTNWLLTSHSCTLPGSRDLPVDSWVAWLRDAQEALHQPVLGGPTAKDWLMLSYKSPARFPQNGTTETTVHPLEPPLLSGWGKVTTEPTVCLASSQPRQRPSLSRGLPLRASPSTNPLLKNHRLWFYF